MNKFRGTEFRIAVGTRIATRPCTEPCVQLSCTRLSIALGAVAVVAGVLGAGGFISARGAYYLGQPFLLYQMFMLFYRMLLMADEASRIASRGR